MQNSNFSLIYKGHMVFNQNSLSKDREICPSIGLVLNAQICGLFPPFEYFWKQLWYFWENLEQSAQLADIGLNAFFLDFSYFKNNFDISWENLEQSAELADIGCLQLVTWDGSRQRDSSETSFTNKPRNNIQNTNTWICKYANVQILRYTNTIIRLSLFSWFSFTDI